eukprot:351638-Chlamydomonas_euryale.AAC.7
MRVSKDAETTAASESLVKAQQNVSKLTSELKAKDADIAANAERVKVCRRGRHGTCKAGVL